MAYRILCLVIGYVFGLFQTGYLYGKQQGIDIRKVGSGNAGTTNALRAMGPKAGAIVMAGDILKCLFAIILTWFLFGRNHYEMDYLLRVYTAFGCILGHNYPFYMNFKGGKGVACTAGLIISFSPWLVLVGIVLFFGTVAVTHYVSLGSLLVGAMLMIGTVILGASGYFHTTAGYLTEIYVLIAIIVFQMYYRHRSNIGRLVKGVENKTYIFKRK
ncbi:MAG: glycerol-3-phosphate 1-O-acyltransferase PlsY [Lachnospiraceae bacterium]|nr:glycerol-3-phosphate 1-O-acyltransferase PlsY [Lachnospiraceae bacterium]